MGRDPQKCVLAKPGIERVGDVKAARGWRVNVTVMILVLWGSRWVRTSRVPDSTCQDAYVPDGSEPPNSWTMVFRSEYCWAFRSRFSATPCPDSLIRRLWCTMIPDDAPAGPCPSSSRRSDLSWSAPMPSAVRGRPTKELRLPAAMAGLRLSRPHSAAR
jgi:hypothetical protein